MSGPQFFETIMGRRFYEGSVPRIARALRSIAASLEVLAQSQQGTNALASKEIPQPEEIPLSTANWTKGDWRRFFESIKPTLIEFEIIPCPANHAAIWNSHMEICPECGEDVTPKTE